MTRRITRSLTDAALARYLAAQLNHSFPDDDQVGADDLAPLLPAILDRVETCFSAIDNKYFFDGREAVFNHLHGDQYAMFLYLASREAHRAGAGAGVASKLFLLNKQLHGIDAFYEVELPDVFLFVHPMGTVLGRGRYGSHLLVYQRCGIGSNHDVYPVLADHVTLHPGSSVLGACQVGSHATLGAGALLLDRDLPERSLYVGTPLGFRIHPRAQQASVWREGA